MRISTMPTGTLAGLVGLTLATPAAASLIVVDWTGDFAIPDIVDPPGVFIDIEVTPDPLGMNEIRDLDVGFMIQSTWQGDLIIAIEHVESGRFHRVLDRPGAPEAGFFGFSADNYGNLATGEPFILDDEADNPYDVPFVGSPGIPDVTGRWQPDTDPLSSFDGDTIIGTWRVWFADQGGGDLAFVRQITLTFDTIPTPGALALLVLAAIRTRRRRQTGTP
ncbi:MAG: hypothetical protein HKO59_10750 [Phycisphaerales bacterium]|nr:hypothetical protein [Phycisphaerae bacterium]NNF42111.1 hypothetical protein [Phycisphaerales bacterium]NNM26442.1 hypothetical protein [Phycisphaerales bacterium]